MPKRDYPAGFSNPAEILGIQDLGFKNLKPKATKLLIFLSHYYLLLLSLAMSKKLLSFFMLLGLAGTIHAQTHIYNSADYSVLKKGGKLPTDGQIILQNEPLQDSTPVLVGGAKSDPCGCYQEPDGTYLLAMAPNDDGSSSLINLPFTFCLYGSNYTSLYINNNGNVSFDAPYITFSASGFPSTDFVMVAPFWGDVDTRGVGQVVYKIFPNAIYINWVNVGYYDSYTDKINTFQLILSDGTDSTAGIGNNVAFCYKDMQWTTGDASSGVGGFGGVPATVGANEGDGVNYIQFGRFDQAGTAYDGPVGANDGVSWLDNQTFSFATCVTTTNIAPIFADFFPEIANTAFNCGSMDTVKICATGDTLVFSAQVIDPNITDVVTLNVTPSNPSGFSIINNSPGNPATITWQYIATVANAGFNTFTVTATDNGTPPLTSTAGFLIYVDSTGTGAFETEIMGDSVICAGETTVFTIPTALDEYYWSNGSTTNNTGIINTAGTYTVTLVNNNCYKTISEDLIVLPVPTVSITGPTSWCSNEPNMILTATGSSAGSPPGSGTYSWNSGATTPTVTPASSGTYTVTYSNGGCTATASHTVTVMPAPTAAFNFDQTSPVFTEVLPHTVGITNTSTIGAPASIVNSTWEINDTVAAVLTGTANYTYPIDFFGIHNITLIVVGNNGCVDSVTQQFEIIPMLQIPNIFTPDGSGANNLFKIKSLNYFSPVTLNIFNRWGTPVLQTTDYKNDWDGTKDGKDLAEGVYYYELVLVTGKVYAGYVQISR